ncbi:hypothetical protein HZB94_04145 [Candidatus Falkowbacteria bacterium]|nr:hypothetical protein [Candidatus Falkowbacteria bacterium]
MAMRENVDLVKAQAGTLTISSEEEPTIFQKFRFAFRAEWCSFRKVYWFDAKWGRTRLWQVLKLDRTSKKQDALIGIFEGEPDIDILRLAIANVNKRKLLTDVRWELYRDFECGQLEAMGRFDFFDLCSPDQEKLRRALGNNIIGVGTHIDDWDFDGLFLTHRCPNCNKFFAKEILIFTPSMMECGHCNYSSADFAAATRNDMIVRELLRLIAEKDEGRFVIAGRASSPTEVFFIDLCATAVTCWLIGKVFHGLPLSKYLESTKDYSIDQIIGCFQKSIFPKLNNELLCRFFRETFQKYYQQEKAEIRNGRHVHSRIAGLTETEHRKWLLDNIEECEVAFYQIVNDLSGLEEWFLFTRSEDYDAMPLVETREKTDKICKALEDFVMYLEQLLELVWQKAKEEENAKRTS